MNNFVDSYLEKLTTALSKVSRDEIAKIVERLDKAEKEQGTIYIIGNGGSAAIASHVSVDFAKTTRIPSATFNNSNLITCFANDYGYENWVLEAIKAYTNKNDLIILISSSGTSNNIVNAAKYCKSNKINLITFSGFNKDNPLSKLGNINFHIDSNKYNYIEMSHHIILLTLVDIFAEKIH